MVNIIAFTVVLGNKVYYIVLCAVLMITDIRNMIIGNIGTPVY